MLWRGPETEVMGGGTKKINRGGACEGRRYLGGLLKE